MVEFRPRQSAVLQEYKSLSTLPILGTLGLITVQNNVFLCVINGAREVATVRPGETAQRVLGVDFCRQSFSLGRLPRRCYVEL